MRIVLVLTTWVFVLAGCRDGRESGATQIVSEPTLSQQIVERRAEMYALTITAYCATQQASITPGPAALPTSTDPVLAALGC